MGDRLHVSGLTDQDERLRIRILIQGAVQGVGFRPYIFKAARRFDLAGWIQNDADGVRIEAEGPKSRLDEFLLYIEPHKPPQSSIYSLESSFLDPVGFTDFTIQSSDRTGKKGATVLPDIRTCPDCLSEINDRTGRRYRYPFTTCTNCGPRFSIIRSLPYDRERSTMNAFTMCPACRREYEDPTDRRFHAEANACPECGPELALWNADGTLRATRDTAWLEAVDAIRRGFIVAVKGIGGFQILADAGAEAAVTELRRRKHRDEKPFALMYPGLARLREDADVSRVEERLLCSPASPIVLVRKRKKGEGPARRGLAEAVAAGHPYLGVMLPYTPLHHLLLAELDMPVVATSGNLSEEPIVIDEKEAVIKLGGIADLFLVHNRPIAQHADDSVVRVIEGRELVLRRARGYAPLPVYVADDLPRAVACGGHLKNTIAVGVGRKIFMSPHIGDLDTFETYRLFTRSIAHLSALYEVKPDVFACDLHPDYRSTRYAEEQEAPAVHVQHHLAHVFSCLAENELSPPALGIAWDGTGYGLDGQIWGGEFFLLRESAVKRIATFRSFPLPGGTGAIREPRRAALGLLYEIYGEKLFAWPEAEWPGSFSAGEKDALRSMLVQSVNAPRTSSVGRLFDAVSSILNVCHFTRYEGQAAMKLEYLTDGRDESDGYPFLVEEAPGVQHTVPARAKECESRSNTRRGTGFTLYGRVEYRGSHTSAEVRDLVEPAYVIDWEPMIRAILLDRASAVAPAAMASKFHNTLVEMTVTIASYAGEQNVLLSGGCFQNAYLTEHVIRALRRRGFRPYWHQRIPPNDGGIALGQLVALSKAMRATTMKMKKIYS